MALPIAKGQEPLAVVLFVSRDRREPADGMERLLESIASHIAQFVERSRLVGAAALDRAHRPADRARQPPRLGRRAGPRARCARAATAGGSASRWSTWTTSSASTTPAATRRATGCWRTPRASGPTLVRPTDALARYGGEEFALLLPHCDT